MQNCFSLHDAAEHSETLLRVAFWQAEPRFSGTGALWVLFCQQSPGLCYPWKSKALPQLDLLQCGRCLGLAMFVLPVRAWDFPLSLSSVGVERPPSACLRSCELSGPSGVPRPCNLSLLALFRWVRSMEGSWV